MCKVLIVEDSAIFRRVVRSILKNAAQEFIECEDGCDAKDAFTKHQPDLVVMDVLMKKKDGITATREIRSFYPDARIVMLSQCDDDGVKEAAYEAGASDYVVKEDLMSLRQIVTEQLAAAPRFEIAPTV